MERITVTLKGNQSWTYLVRNFSEKGYDSSVIMGAANQNQIRRMVAILMRFEVDFAALEVYSDIGGYVLAYRFDRWDQSGYYGGLIKAAQRYRKTRRQRRRRREAACVI